MLRTWRGAHDGCVCVLRGQDGIEPTILHTHRGDVDAINQEKLNELPGPSVAFTATGTRAGQTFGWGHSIC